MTAVAQAEQMYWRELRESEKHVAFQDIVNDLDITANRITRSVRTFEKAWLKDIRDKLPDAIKEGPVAIAAVTAIAKSMRVGLRKIISREQRTLYTLGELHVQQELQRQQSIQLVRRDPPTVQQVVELFKVRSQTGIDAFAERSQRYVREAALEAWRAYGDSLTPKQLAQVIGEAIDVSGRQSQLFSRRIGMESFNMGRDRRARLQYDAIKDVEYSALMDDGNVCLACADADGTVTTMDSPTYFKLMPPNHQCRSRKSGFNNCRCMWLYRVRDEVSDLPDPSTMFKPPAADGSIRKRPGVELTEISLHEHHTQKTHGRRKRGAWSEESLYPRVEASDVTCTDEDVVEKSKEWGDTLKDESYSDYSDLVEYLNSWEESAGQRKALGGDKDSEKYLDRAVSTIGTVESAPTFTGTMYRGLNFKTTKDREEFERVLVANNGMLNTGLQSFSRSPSVAQHFATRRVDGEKRENPLWLVVQSRTGRAIEGAGITKELEVISLPGARYVLDKVDVLYRRSGGFEQPMNVYRMTEE